MDVGNRLSHFCGEKDRVSCEPKAAPLWGCFFVSQAGKERQKISAWREEDGILINRKLVAKVFINLFETDG